MNRSVLVASTWALGGLVHSALLATAIAVISSSAAQAATMYKWVDEAGVTHFADKVPEKYKVSARTIDSRGSELSDQQKRVAAEDARRLLQSAAPAAPAPVPASAPAAVVAGSQGVRKQAGGDECEVLWRTYFSAVACWDQGPKTRWGTPNMAAGRNCAEVQDPSPKCGTPKLRPQDRIADYPAYPPGDESRWSPRNAR